MHVEEEDKEPRPAGRGLKRKRDARKSKEGEEREEEREFEKREGETRKRNKPFRTGKFHNPKCERCETEGESCEKQKTGVACYQCATRRARCKPTGGKLRKPPIPTPTVVEKLALAPASRVAQQVEEDDPFGDIAAHRKKSTVRFADQATPSKKRERNWISSDAPKRTPKPPTPSPSPDPQPSSPKPAITVPQTSPQSTQTGFICDKQYYHESGDFAFVVEDTLFKVNTLIVFQTVACKLLMNHCGPDTPIPARKM
jgi:ribosomal protein S27E